MNATAPLSVDKTGNDDFDSADWNPIPFNLREGLHEYLRIGRPTGDFLKAVLSNHFVEACLRADHMSELALKATAQFLTWYAPPSSYGSPAKYDAWVKRGGLVGVPRGTTLIVSDTFPKHMRGSVAAIAAADKVITESGTVLKDRDA